MNRVPAELGCSTARVARSLDRLRELGLIARRSGQQRRYAAIDPQAAVEALVRTRAGELDRTRSAAGELARLFVAARADGAEQIEVVRGSDALLLEVQDLARRGEQAWVLPGLRVELAVADRRLALLPLTFDLTDVRAVVVRPSALLDALVDFFELCRRQAVPLHGEAGDELGDEDRSLLALMAAGLKDEAIARRLGWSPRTMRRRVSALLTRLGATNRFQAGAIAARRGWL
ncbi:LuxR C-terminal-related transcriptional regulator [Streptomyces sp. NPDC091217]|uniref:helix-turn-helix transcriptional regulator n=1 Tax=Streptomyces sp. NPDC091217 TaxID=3365975 RepID=UPI00380E6515